MTVSALVVQGSDHCPVETTFELVGRDFFPARPGMATPPPSSAWHLQNAGIFQKSLLDAFQTSLRIRSSHPPCVSVQPGWLCLLGPPNLVIRPAEAKERPLCVAYELHPEKRFAMETQDGCSSLARERPSSVDWCNRPLHLTAECIPSKGFHCYYNGDQHCLIIVHYTDTGESISDTSDFELSTRLSGTAKESAGSISADCKESLSRQCLENFSSGPASGDLGSEIGINRSHNTLLPPAGFLKQLEAELSNNPQMNCEVTFEAPRAVFYSRPTGKMPSNGRPVLKCAAQILKLCRFMQAFQAETCSFTYWTPAYDPLDIMTHSRKVSICNVPVEVLPFSDVVYVFQAAPKSQLVSSVPLTGVDKVFHNSGPSAVTVDFNNVGCQAVRHAQQTCCASGDSTLMRSDLVKWIDFLGQKERSTYLEEAPTAPLCEGHRLPCVKRKVKRSGPHMGKEFWACVLPEGKLGDRRGRCRTFRWVSSRPLSSFWLSQASPDR